MTTIAELIKGINDLKETFGGDGVKVYFKDEANYTIKIIKAGAIVKRFGLKTDASLKAWDLKKGEK